MKKILHTILFMLFALYVNCQPVVWGIYAATESSYAKIYCENPDKPACHGKCHVNKVTEGKNSSAEVSAPEISPFIEYQKEIFSPREKFSITEEIFSAEFSLLSGPAADIEHPPCR